MLTECPFCDYSGPLKYEGAEFIAFEPLNPVVPGHFLVVPKLHVPDAGWDFQQTGWAFEVAARVAGMHGYRDYNLIVNKGAEAGQSVFHLHVHVLPRRAGDAVRMPWSDQRDADGQRLPANQSDVGGLGSGQSDGGNIVAGPHPEPQGGPPTAPTPSPNQSSEAERGG